MKFFSYCSLSIVILFYSLPSFSQNTQYEYTQADAAARKAVESMSLKEKVFEMHGRGIMSFGASMIFKKKFFIIIKFTNITNLFY